MAFDGTLLLGKRASKPQSVASEVIHLQLVFLRFVGCFCKMVKLWFI